MDIREIQSGTFPLTPRAERLAFFWQYLTGMEGPDAIADAGARFERAHTLASVEMDALMSGYRWTLGQDDEGYHMLVDTHGARLAVGEDTIPTAAARRFAAANVAWDVLIDIASDRAHREGDPSLGSELFSLQEDLHAAGRALASFGSVWLPTAAAISEINAHLAYGIFEDATTPSKIADARASYRSELLGWGPDDDC